LLTRDRADSPWIGHARRIPAVPDGDANGASLSQQSVVQVFAILRNRQAFRMLMVSAQKPQRIDRMLQTWIRRRHTSRGQILRMGIDNEVGSLIVHTCHSNQATAGYL